MRFPFFSLLVIRKHFEHLRDERYASNQVNSLKRSASSRYSRHERGSQLEKPVINYHWFEAVPQNNRQKFRVPWSRAVETQLNHEGKPRPSLIILQAFVARAIRTIMGIHLHRGSNERIRFIRDHSIAICSQKSCHFSPLSIRIIVKRDDNLSELVRVFMTRVKIKLAVCIMHNA